MFCEKCGREIAEDSIYCAYCGLELPHQEEELDWEEAARLREAAERRAGSIMPRRVSSKQYHPGCVAPGAPKKKCPGCGKELPSSTVSDFCALCTMRREHEEEKRAERAAEEQYEREVAAGKRDRYDISDEFDWRALQGDPPSQPPAAPSQPASGWNAEKKTVPVEGKRKKKTPWGLGIVILVCFAFLPRLFGAIEDAASGINHYGTMAERAPVEEAQDVMADSSAPFFSGDETPDWAVWKEWGEPSNDQETFDVWVRPMVEWALESFMPDLNMPREYFYLEDDSLEWYVDGVQNRVTGSAYCFDEEGEGVVVPFDIVVVVEGDEPDGSGYVLGFAVDGETLFDDVNLVDSDGLVTEEGTELFGRPAGGYPYEDTPPRYLGNN